MKISTFLYKCHLFFISQRIKQMTVDLSKLSATIDSYVAKYSTLELQLSQSQADLTAANAALTDAQAQVDALVAKLPA